MIQGLIVFVLLNNILMSQMIGVHSHISREVNWDPEYKNRFEIVEKLKKNNINLVRIGINWRHIEKKKRRI